MMKTLVCTACSRTLPEDAFKRHHRTGTGRTRRCIECLLPLERRCSKCKEVKPRADFYIIHGGTRLYSSCIACHSAYGKTRTRDQRRRNHLSTTFKLSWSQYEAMLERQEFRCATCREPLDVASRHTHVDHDRSCCPGARSCGKCVREVLCSACNTSLGLLKEDPDTLRRLLSYIERWS